VSWSRQQTGTRAMLVIRPGRNALRSARRLSEVARSGVAVPVGARGRRNSAKCAAVSRGQVIFGVRGALTSAPDAEAVEVAAVIGMAAHGAGERSPNLRSRA
jgi:hypothetical protein